MGAEVTLVEERAHYLLSVLRMRAGDVLTVFDGRGGEYSAELITASRHQVRLKIGSFKVREVESPLPVHLGLAVARGERMDFSIQKATELGVASIAPLLTERCTVCLAGKEESKLRHWEKIAIAACEQCGRNKIPQILTPQTFEQWLAAQSGGVLLDPTGMPFPRLTQPSHGLTLLVGPEGGLSAEERQRALEAGFIAASLGPRILRVETAVVAALSLAQALWGDGRA